MDRRASDLADIADQATVRDLEARRERLAKAILHHPENRRKLTDATHRALRLEAEGRQ